MGYKKGYSEAQKNGASRVRLGKKHISTGPLKSYTSQPASLSIISLDFSIGGNTYIEKESPCWKEDQVQQGLKELQASVLTAISSVRHPNDSRIPIMACKYSCRKSPWL